MPVFVSQGEVGGASLLVESWEACLSIPGCFSSLDRVFFFVEDKVKDRAQCVNRAGVCDGQTRSA